MRNFFLGLYVTATLLVGVLVYSSMQLIDDIGEEPQPAVTWVDVDTARGERLRCYMFEEKVTLICEVLDN